MLFPLFASSVFAQPPPDDEGLDDNEKKTTVRTHWLQMPYIGTLCCFSTSTIVLMYVSLQIMGPCRTDTGISLATQLVII
jgi:hypothetical protein